MPTITITTRIASPVPYEFWEATVTAPNTEDAYAAMVEVEAYLQDHRGKATPGPTNAIETATQNLQQQGVVGVNPGLSDAAPASPPWGGGGGSTQQRPSWGGNGGGNASGGQDFGRELGEFNGAKITVHATGKFGPYVKGYGKGLFKGQDKVYANLPKGQDASQVTLDQAVALISAKLGG